MNAKLAACPAMAWDEKNRDEWAKRYLERLALAGAGRGTWVTRGVIGSCAFCVGTCQNSRVLVPVACFDMLWTSSHFSAAGCVSTVTAEDHLQRYGDPFGRH